MLVTKVTGFKAHLWLIMCQQISAYHRHHHQQHESSTKMSSKNDEMNEIEKFENDLGWDERV